MLDTVTGLRDSRALWRELAQRAASCCASSPLAVLVFDFDRFGELNERYDSTIGDAVLRRCAEVAALQTPSGRLAFRYRDDELVVLVPGDEEDAREIAERIRDRIAAQNHSLPAITVSCGIAVLRAPVEPLVAVGKSGPALQAAKQAGGNRVVVSSELGRNGCNGRNGGDGDESTARRAALAMAVASLEARDRGTAAHSEDVVTLCDSIGTRLGLSDEQLDRLAAAAQLHDVGKLAMPTEILNKPGRLDDDEWEIIRQHTVIGERMLRAVPEMGAVAGMVRHSHERWDGRGYPDGLAGDEIPLASRIVLCADAFHAIRSDRPYRPGRSADAALKEVRSHAGSQFDPRVVDALIAVARDVRRADGTAAALPRSRRLAALLAALAVVGGGSAYAASENVRSVVDRVVRVVVPDTVLGPEKADAADFSLRPIDEVPEITPVAALTPDLEFPQLRAAAEQALGAPAASQSGVPASAVSDGPGFATSGPVAQVGEPVAQQEVQLPPEHAAPEAPALIPIGTDVVALEPSAPGDSVVQAEAVPAPALVPVAEIEDEPAAAGNPPVAGNPHGGPPAVGNPHGTPPGQTKQDDVDDTVEPEQEEGNVPPAEPESKPEHPHADGDLPPGLAHVIEKNPEHPHAPAPAANVVTPAPSIAVPSESIFVPPESLPAPPEVAPAPAEPAFDPPGTPSLPPAPPVPAVRPPEYAPDSLLAETPASD